MNDRERKLKLLELLQKKQILRSRKSFWEFCKTREPDFYRDSRGYLKEICDTLQDIYENKLINPKTNEPYKNLMLNIPPRHGKSRTLTNFTAWCLGKDITNMIMTISYNADSATEFSRFTRDIIAEDKVGSNIIFADIFPGVQLQQGNASVQKWALEGRFFNYLGAGFDGSVTGKGCNIMIIDDPIKNAEEALNETYLDKVYAKYVNTLLSRIEGNGIQIVCMTRWSKNDLCGKILTSEDGDDWYVLKLPAYDSQADTMLCDELLDKKKYLRLKRNMDEIIFLSNYDQEPIDAKGLLYQSFKTYTALPVDSTNTSMFEKVISYTDTADKGSDYLVSLIGGVLKGELWILDVYISNKGMEVTEPDLAKFFYMNNLQHNFNYAKIESNNGGRGFARNVERLLWEIYKTRDIVFHWFHQSKNKEARILANSNYVMQHVYFPEDWKSRWPLFYKLLSEYKRDGKNTHDDPADCLTGLVEMVSESINVHYDKAVYSKGMGLKDNVIKLYNRKVGGVF